MLNWEIGERVDNAVWITVFLVLVVTFNMFPVRVWFSFTGSRSDEHIDPELLTLALLVGVWRA